MKHGVALYWMVVTVFLTSCVTVRELSPSAYLYATPSELLDVEDLERIKASRLRAGIPAPFRRVWESALIVLAGHTAILKLTANARGVGTISYIDSDVLSQDKEPFVVDMPYTLLIEESSRGGTAAYLYPWIELIEGKKVETEVGLSMVAWLPVIELTRGKYSPEQMATIKQAMQAMGQRFLDRLATQATADKRWLWLGGE